MKILVDEMYQNIYLRLLELGYDVYSVRDLVEKENMKMKSDYSIIKYAEENNMVLITEDGENKKGCDENGIPCISLGQNPDINAILAGLERLRTN